MKFVVIGNDRSFGKLLLLVWDDNPTQAKQVIFAPFLFQKCFRTIELVISVTRTRPDARVIKRELRSKEWNVLKD